MFTVKVEGIPTPKGSKTLAGLKTGKPYMREANKALPAWMIELKTVLAMKMLQSGAQFTGPLQVEILFLMPRPKSVTREYPSVKPDTDKLCRAILDAAEQAGVYFNDSQVVDLYARKRYADNQTPGAIITISNI